MASTVFGLGFAHKGVWEALGERLAADGVGIESSKVVEEYLGQRRDRSGRQGSNYVFEFFVDN